MALGLEYLHGLQPSVVHGDLKGVSLLCIKGQLPRLNSPFRPMSSSRNLAGLAWLTSVWR
jgi:hypothetical protein